MPDATDTSKRGRLRLLVLQPTPFCNIDCVYCYLAHRNSTERMSLAALELVCRRVFESPFIGQRLQVAWHGGEPLAAGLPWYENVMPIFARTCPADVQLQHCFQTNGLLLNKSWTRFFARTQATVGLSLDGPADIHDANRRTRRGRGTHDGVMRAVRLLQDQAQDFHVITVLTEHTLDHPERLFDFYVENGIREVGFNIEEIEAAHRRSSLASKRAEEKFQDFIGRFFRLVWTAPNLLRVRELEDAIALLLSEEPVEDEQNIPFAIVSVGWDGTISTFSPELLGACHGRFESFAFGHVATHQLCDLAEAPSFGLVNREIQRGVQACERSCSYFRWCGGGAPANKLFETRRFDSTETMHCRLIRQVVLKQTLELIEAYVGGSAGNPRTEL